MNWPRFVVEYGDIIAITMLMGSLIGALVIVLRGFQAQRLLRNVLSGLGVLLCSLCMFSSLRYMRTASGKTAPLKQVFRNVGQPAPDLAYWSLNDDSTHHLSDFSGKLVVLNIWATWSPACRAELSDLNRLQEAYGDRVVVLTISDEDADTISKYEPLATTILRKGRVHSGSSAGLYISPDVARPVTHIIDAHGILRKTLLGPQSFEQLETETVRYLAPKG